MVLDKALPPDHYFFHFIWMTSQILSRNVLFIILLKLRSNGILSKVRHYLLIKMLTSIYYSLVLVLHYMWFENLVVHVSKNIIKIFVLQQKCTRLITFFNWQDHTVPILKILKILKSHDHIKSNIVNAINF